MIEEIDVYSVEELVGAFNGLPNHYIYRGHAKAEWKLESTLERIIGTGWSVETATKFESFALSQFQSKFHLYDRENVSPRSKLAWLSIMQHYGVPTRLLDFTESPYVALYFALEAHQQPSTSDFAIFAVDYRELMRRSRQFIATTDADFRDAAPPELEDQDTLFERIVDRFTYDIAWVTEPKELNARLDRQAGSFLLSGNRGLRIEEVLKSAMYDGVHIQKYKIQNALYSGLFSLLKKMNITSKSLYGDLDGLARSLRMQMQAYAP